MYLINYPKIDTHIYNTLIAIASSCTPGDALSAKKTMTQIGIIWTDDTHDDPIFAQFITKAAYAENGLREVASI
jgi:hypothetical protein